MELSFLSLSQADSGLDVLSPTAIAVYGEDGFAGHVTRDCGGRPYLAIPVGGARNERFASAEHAISYVRRPGAADAGYRHKDGLITLGGAR